jgi:hypothetical protein
MIVPITNNARAQTEKIISKKFGVGVLTTIHLAVFAAATPMFGQNP